MLPTWLILTILAGLSSNLFNTLLRRTLRGGHDATAYAWWFELIRASTFFLFLWWDYSFVYTPINLFWLIALGLSEVVGVYTYMKMHASTQLSVSSVVMRLRSVWVVLLAFIFLGERLSNIQYTGIVTIILGTLILNNHGKLRTDASFRNSLFFTLASAISTIIIKHVSTYASISVINFAFSFPSVILIPLLMKNSLPRLLSNLPFLRSTFTVAFFNTFTMVALVWALKLGNASQVIGVLQGITMLTVVIGIFALNERDHISRKLIAATIATLGITLLV